MTLADDMKCWKK